MATTQMPRLPQRALAALFVLPLLAGCEPATAPAPRVAALVISNAVDSVNLGATRQLVATATSASGSTISGAPVTWASSATSIATVSEGGLVTAVGVGSTFITATSGTATRSVVINVRYPVCAASTQPTLALGDGRNGTIGGAGSCLVFGEYRAFGYPVTLSASGGARFSVTASGFEPVLFLLDAGGWVVDVGVSSDGVTATMRTVQAAGSYSLYVAANGPPASTNSFALTSAVTAGNCTGTITRPITVDAGATAAVGDASCVLLGGPIAEGWRLTLGATQRVRVTATSAAFAPVVAITSPMLEFINANVAMLPGSTSVSSTLPAGEYLLWGGTFAAASGDVTITVEEVEPCPAAGVLALPSVVNGALAITDCPMEGFETAFGDPWTMTLAEPTMVELNLTSGSFDTYLELRTADDVFLDADDDGGTMANSRLVRMLPAGTYRVWATSFAGGVTGDYTLSAAVAGSGLVAPPEATTGPSAKPGRLRSAPWPAPRGDGTRRKE